MLNQSQTLTQSELQEPQTQILPTPTPLARAKVHNETMTTVLAAFLVSFDVKAGNSIIWSRSQPGYDINLTGLEFRSMPSGLHTMERDVISFVQSTKDGEEHIEGIAVFKQRTGKVIGGSIDRSTVKMYSLGVLCPRGSSEMSSKCWGYVGVLDRLLDRFLDEITEEVGSESSSTKDKFSIFDILLDNNRNDYFNSGNGISGSGVSLNSSVSVDFASNHPILSTTDFLNIYGPSIFELWKSAILRNRILLVDSSGLTSIESLCKYVYILSVFGTIPSDILGLIPRDRHSHINTNPLYNITISDISQLQSVKHFIATTTDDIILEKKQLYDLAVMIKPNGQVAVIPSSINISGMRGPTGTVHPTLLDKRRYDVLISALGVPIGGRMIRRSSSFSIFNPPGEEHFYSHWLENFSDRIGSLFSVNAIYGLLWWATAGEQASLDTDRDLEGLPLLRPPVPEGNEHHDRAESPSEPWQVSAIGYFQAKTRRLFRTISNLIEIQDSEQGASPFPSVITIEPPDLIDMGLDPVSERDHEFVIEVINVWWGLPVRVNHICSNPCC